MRASKRPGAVHLPVAATIGACGVVTYPIGGLAYLVGSFFLVFSLLAGPRPHGRMVFPVIVLGLATVATLGSLLDPGGSIFIALPVGVPLVAWAIHAIRYRA